MTTVTLSFDIDVNNCINISNGASTLNQLHSFSLLALLTYNPLNKFVCELIVSPEIKTTGV